MSILPVIIAAEQNHSALEYWLKFLSTFVWQVIVVGFLVRYRHELNELLRNISKFKVFGFEGEIQKTTGTGPVVAPDAMKKLEAIGPGGFLTIDGLKQVVEVSGLVDKNDHVRDTCNIFRTSRQRTWLMSTSDKLVCILDDDEKREAGELIRWIMEKKDATPIKATPYKRTVGLVSIGPRTNWLYSTSLFSTPESLERRVQQLIA